MKELSIIVLSTSSMRSQLSWPNPQWRGTQNGSEDVTVRMRMNVLSWFRHVERMSDERMAKKIYDGKVSVKRGRGRPRLTFENTVSKVLEEGHVKSMRILRGGGHIWRGWWQWMRWKRYVAFGAPFSLTTPLGIARS